MTVVPPVWSTALPDWERRILAGESLVPCPPLFPAEAEAAMAIFRELRLVDVAGSPTIGEACRPWVLDWAAAVFGSYDAETGRRLIRYFFLLVSKKNTKSTLAAAIVLTLLIRNWRLSAPLAILAPTIEVAGNSFAPARDMIRADEELSDLLHVQDHLRTITHRTTHATLRVVAADSETVGGMKASIVLIDELWLFGKRAGAENMMREATGGLASRPEGLVMYLSTQSDTPPAGVFAQQLRRFRDVRDGIVIDPRSMGVLYEYPEHMLKDGSFRDPANFHITNPNLGASVDLEFLLDEHRQAERDGEGSFRGFAAKHLNVEIGIGQLSNHWAGVKYWERRADPTLTLAALLDRSEVVVVGIDGGGLDDLFGMAVLGREKVAAGPIEEGGTRPEKRWLLWSHAWCHEGVLDVRKSIASRLLDFQKAGELTIVDDELEDLSAIVAHVEAIKDRGILAEVAVDPAGLGELVDALAAIGVTEANKFLVGVGQGYRLMNAIKTAERRLANGTLWHGGSDLMAWCVGNVKIEPTATAIRATKQNAGDAKIDPWMAGMNAVDRMSLNPAARGNINEFLMNAVVA